MSNTRRIKRETTFGDDIVHGLRDFFGSVKKGETITVRTVRLDLEPAKYDAVAVKHLRQRLQVSQAIFAQLLAVSVDLVQGWEQGRKNPSPMARRLLDDISGDPARWLIRLGRSAKTMPTSGKRRPLVGS